MVGHGQLEIEEKLAAAWSSKNSNGCHSEAGAIEQYAPDDEIFRLDTQSLWNEQNAATGEETDQDCL
ncbi:MAG: hypothetical protein ONB31_09850 [candidate division KSB1 bacterium]|nr:hypothetical protein [candidate division KSB1 bacterium]MDZ7335488.1 hypothetical protein [candidate division KSB1 bacterium]MDZ7357637.1 hypothetical protein [candidate division KSB1 bacterium]